MKKELMKALLKKTTELKMYGVTNIKAYEVAYQEVIEKITGAMWWEVTDCNIFMHLLEHKSPALTMRAIIDNLKEGYNHEM